MSIPVRRNAGLLRFFAVATLPTLLLASPAWAGTRIGTLPPGLVAALARQEARAASHNPLDRIGRTGCTQRSREGTKACFGTRTTRIESGRSRLSLRLVSWGRPGHLMSWARAGERVAANRVQAREEGLVSWWRVLPMGYEEGFTLEHAPKGEGSPGEVEIVLHSNRTPEEGDGGLSWGRIRYGALWVTDARGKVLPSRIRVQGRRIELWLDTAGARYPVRVDPLVWVEQALTNPSNLTTSAGFGRSVVISGTTAVVGAPYQNSSQGAAYVYTESNGSWGTGTELALPSGLSTYAEFGYSVAISGTTIVVGAPYQSGGTVYVYTESNGTWSGSTLLTTPSRAPSFGSSVAISGSTIVVGAPGQNSSQGAAYVYTGSGSSWSGPTQLATPTGVSTGAHFGYSVAVSGTTIVVGAPVQNSTTGAAYVYTETNGNWSGATPLATPSGTSELGYSVAISGTTAVVGAPGQNSNTGAAYAYDSADLDLVLDTPSSVKAGSNYTSQAIFTNKSNYASPALTVRMPIPSGAGYVSSIPTQGSCSETSALLSCDLGSLAASGGIASASVELKPASSATNTSLTNQASLALSSPALSQSTTTEVVAEPTVTGLADLSVKVTASTPAAESFSITGTGTLTVSAVSSNPTLLPDNGISLSSGCDTSGATCSLALTPAKDEVGSATVTVTVTDMYGNQGSGSFVYTVNDVAPTATGGSVSTLENTAVNGTLSGTAAYAGQTLTYELVSAPSHDTSVQITNPATGAFVYTPAPGYVGTDSFTFEVKDGSGTVSNVATETVTVKAATQTPSGGSSGGGGVFGILDLLALGMIIGLRGMIERRSRSREGLARGA